MAEKFNRIKDVLIGRKPKDYLVPGSSAAEQYRKMHGPTPTTQKQYMKEAIGASTMMAPINTPLKGLNLGKLNSLWQGSKLARRTGRSLAGVGTTLGSIAGLGWIRNKVLEAEDAYNYNPDAGKMTPIDEVPGMADWKKKQAEKDIVLTAPGKKSGTGGSGIYTGTSSSVPAGASTSVSVDPYANRTPDDIAYVDRPGEKFRMPVMVPGTLKRVTDFGGHEELMRAFAEYKGTEPGEEAPTEDFMADFYKNLGKMKKDELDGFISWYKKRGTE